MRYFLIFPVLSFFALCLSGQPSHAQMLTGFEDISPVFVPPPQEFETTQLAMLTSPEGWDAVPRATAGNADGFSVAPLEGTDTDNSEQAPVDLQADRVDHDEKNQTVTAEGNVMLVQAGRIFRADAITYYLKEDRVIATGHTVLNEENGDIHYSEKAELKNKFKDGFVEGLKTYLADGSRFTSKQGERVNGTRTTMKDATYTPCEECKNDPDKPPMWQIHASEVTHDTEEHRVEYENARFEVMGVPVAYTPYFSHADGTIKRKSGFLSPSVGYKSNLGEFVRSRYYWNIAPDKDATADLTVMTNAAPLLIGEYRQRWDKASLEMEGGITYSDRTDSIGDLEVKKGEEVRGHIKAKGLWDMNEKWRSGLNINWVSDDQYMRQYDIRGANVLKNEIYAERFSGRDYAVGRLLAFEDIRTSELAIDQPQIIPEIVASFIGEPGEVPIVGGRWDFSTSMLGLRREGDNQDHDMHRFSVDAGWKRRLVSDYGLLTSADLSLRGDLYYARDRLGAGNGTGISDESRASRFYPQMHVQTSYPMVRNFEETQATIEPIVALTVAPRIRLNTRIPNEDSQDVQADASNIFESNRFPGIDRVEDESRVTYGLKTGLYGMDGSYGDIFLGQSYRLEDNDNPFPAGSGFENQSSDFVGQLTGIVKDKYTFNYRFQLASDDLTSQRHEVDAGAVWGRLSLGTRYLFANALAGTDISETREQINNSIGYYLSKEWQVRGGATTDLGENSGLRQGFVALDYFGQCLYWTLTGQQNYYDDSSGQSDTEILFTIGLKNLGGFLTSGYKPVDEHDQMVLDQD